MVDIPALRAYLSGYGPDSLLEIGERAIHSAHRHLVLAEQARRRHDEDSVHDAVRHAFGTLALAVLATRPAIGDALALELTAVSDTYGSGAVSYSLPPVEDRTTTVGSALQGVLTLSAATCAPDVAATFAKLVRALGVTQISRPFEARPLEPPPQGIRGWAVAGMALHLGTTRAEVEQLLTELRKGLPPDPLKPSTVRVGDGPLGGDWTLAWRPPLHGCPVALASSDTVSGAPLRLLYSSDGIAELWPALLPPLEFDLELHAVFSGAMDLRARLEHIWGTLSGLVESELRDFGAIAGEGWSAIFETDAHDHAYLRVAIDGRSFLALIDPNGFQRLWHAVR